MPKGKEAGNFLRLCQKTLSHEPQATSNDKAGGTDDQQNVTQTSNAQFPETEPQIESNSNGVSS